MPDVGVSVVVPVRDGARQLPACLDALAAQEGAPAFEVVVVDNGSRDDTAALARGHELRPRVVTEPRPGSYRARNAGIRAAVGDVVAFTDADCRPRPGWLRAGVHALATYDVVGGAVRQTRGAVPTVWELWDSAHYLDQEALVVQGFAATANLLTRRGLLDLVGGFDDALLSSGDLDLCRRAGRQGARIGYAATAVVEHPTRSTVAATWRLHRRLGAGWHVLAARGERPPAWRDPWMRPSLAGVAAALVQSGTPVRRRQLAGVHAVVLAARWCGRVTGR